MDTVSSAGVPIPRLAGGIALSRPTDAGLARLPDELLARHAESGSARAFAALFARYHQPLYRYCRSLLREETDAQDALQSKFLGALPAMRDGRRAAPVRPWLFRIAHNEYPSTYL